MNTSSTRKDVSFVSVMVPADRVLDVYAFLAESTGPAREEMLQKDPTETLENDVQQYFRLPESKDWPESLLRRAYRESSPAMKAVFDVIIEKAGSIVHSYELVEAIAKVRGKECDHLTLAGTLGAFGRRVANRYQRKDWPMYTYWDGAANEVQYKMAPEVAEKMNS